MATFHPNFLEFLYGQLADLGAAEDIAEEAYSMAIDMCGNDGQISVIERTEDGYHRAAESALAGSGSAEMTLRAYCPYPEAVSEILGETAQVIEDMCEEIRGDALYAGEWDEGEFEGDEEEEEFWE